jgi:hypothetical protein
MSEELVPFLTRQPHITFATGTMGQPLGGFDILMGIDLAQFNRLSGGFRFVRGGPFQNDDDVILDEYYAREKKLDVGSAITLANHAWRVSGVFESGKLSRICARLNVLQDLTGNSRFYSRDFGHDHGWVGANARDRNTEGTRGFIRLHSQPAISRNATDRDHRQRFRNHYDVWKRNG